MRSLKPGAFEKIVLVTDSDQFVRLSLLTHVAIRSTTHLIPMQSNAEVEEALSSSGKILIVVYYSQSSGEVAERIISSAIENGLPICSLQIFRSEFLGYDEIENTAELLQWNGSSNAKNSSAAFIAFTCIFMRFIAALLLTAVSPLLLCIGLGIRMCSPGPAIYRQIRLGYRGRPFTLYKFRSMTLNAERNGPQWASGDDDHRCFKFGKFLRRTHLDELPQLWNIVKGELCFVGLRPERPEFHNVIESKIPLFKVRTQVKPGVTGWAQISSGYASSIQSSKMKLFYDLFYIRKVSFTFRSKIICHTFKKIVFEIISECYRLLLNKRPRARVEE